MVSTFKQLMTRFLTWCKKARKPSTTAVYRHYLRKFDLAHVGLRLAELTPAIVEAWAQTWHDVQAIARLCVWATSEARIMISNPIEGVKHPPKGERRRIMSRHELVTLLRAAKPDCRRLLTAYRETMARPEELRLASWEDLKASDPTQNLREALQLGRASIVLYEYKNRVNRKNPEAPRVILLSPRACRLLLRLYDKSPTKKGRIFITSRGNAWTGNALRCRFRRLRVKLDIQRDKRGETIVPYTFRHTGATIAAAKGVRDRILADVLGHVETKTTARYQHLQHQHLIDALQSVWVPTKKKGKEQAA